VTALREVAAYLPEAVPIEQLADRLSLSTLDVRVFHRLHGLRAVRMAQSPWEQTLIEAAGGLRELAEHPERVRYVIAARSVIPASETSAFPLDEVCAKLGVPHAVAFILADHACASGLLGVDIAGKLLAGCGDPDALALVLTGEKAPTREIQLIPETTIMGEATAACLVSASGERDRVLGYVSRPLPRQTPQDAYPQVLAEVLVEAVREAGLTWGDIEVILPHNVNKVLWVRICRSIGLPIERVWLDGVPANGHCFSADTFLNYLTAREQGLLREGQAYLMAAAGLGAVASAMVFRH
jgi:3-oxoacyl-[acyl-carrier-protein] synthase III